MALQALRMMSPSPIGPSWQPQFWCSTRETSNVLWKIAQALQNHLLENQHVPFFPHLSEKWHNAAIAQPPRNRAGLKRCRPFSTSLPLFPQSTAGCCEGSGMFSVLERHRYSSLKKISWYFGYLETNQKRGTFVKICTLDALSFQIKDPTLMQEHIGVFSPDK